MTETPELDGLPLDQRQTLAYQQWKELSLTTGMPPRQREFRPDRIVRTLPASMLLHVERGDAGVRFRQRLEGRFVTLAFGDGMGRLIEDIYNDEYLFDLMPRYLEAAMTGDPAMTRCVVAQDKDDSFSFTRLILPFAGNDGKVNRLFVVFHFDPIALARLSAPLKIHRQILPELARRAYGQKAAHLSHKSDNRKFG